MFNLSKIITEEDIKSNNNANYIIPARMQPPDEIGHN